MTPPPLYINRFEQMDLIVNIIKNSTTAAEDNHYWSNINIKCVELKNNSYMFPCSRNTQVTLVEKLYLKIISFRNYKHWYLDLDETKLLREASQSLHEGSLEITLTVPLSLGIKLY